MWLKHTHLGVLLTPWKQVGVMLTGPNEHNGRLDQVECMYQLVHSPGAPVAGKDHGIVFRRVNCISENIPCLMPTTVKQTWPSRVRMLSLVWSRTSLWTFRRNILHPFWEPKEYAKRSEWARNSICQRYCSLTLDNEEVSPTKRQQILPDYWGSRHCHMNLKYKQITFYIMREKTFSIITHSSAVINNYT
jgi:hypothetical protein